MIVRTMAMLVATFALLVPMGAAPASAAPDSYTPKAGPTFNSPLGSSSKQRAIFRKIIRSVNSTPRGEEIDIFSWNFLTREGADALLRAARRNVRVRLLMDDANTDIEGDPNSPYFRLKAGLRKENRGRPPHRRGWARTCEGTCRGGGGAPHSKFFLFSRVGKADKVYMQGSANLTVASTTNQWNDLYTHRGNGAVWDFAKRVFTEASLDTRAADPYATKSFGNFRLLFFPNTGTSSPDPVMQMLNKVRCRGATNTGNGRTHLRLAPDVLRNARGMKIAKKIRSLWNDGCDVKLGYTVVGIDIGRYLRREGGRGPVPMKHLAQDNDGDGDFDNYFHLKSMTIRGNYAGDRSGWALLNGSANWSGLGAISDENLGIYRAEGRVRQYEGHLEFWYNNFPSTRSSNSTSTSTRTSAPLVFGSGANAIYENGAPVSTDGTNPFAEMEMD